MRTSKFEPEPVNLSTFIVNLYQAILLPISRVQFGMHIAKN